VGPQGPTGPGFTGIERISDASPLDSADVKTLDVGCPAGNVVLTGGARVATHTFQTSATVFLNWSAPLVITGETAPTRWVARAGEATVSDLDWSLVVWVWCVDDPRGYAARPGAVITEPHRTWMLEGILSAPVMPPNSMPS